MLFWPSDLQPWRYDRLLELFMLAITLKLYKAIASYFQGISSCHGTYVLWGYFDLWPWHYDSYLENLDILYHPKLYMIAVTYCQFRSILHGTCVQLGYFNLLSSSLENMTFTLKLLFWPLLRHYKWQLLHTFRVHQPIRGPMYCAVILNFWPLTFTLWHLSLKS